VGEVGELVLTGVWIHVFLMVGIRFYFLFFEKPYFAILASTFYYGTFSKFLWSYRLLAFNYFVSSLVAGYCFGFVHGLLIIKQPIRSWVARRRFPARVLRKLGLTGFLQEEPVWYFVLKQRTPATMVFLEVEMKNGAGIYAGTLKSYGILDDSVKSKDFYMENVYFKEKRSAPFTRLACNGVLVNFEDVASIQVVKVEPEESIPKTATEPADTKQIDPQP